jgi:hypothetical protein
MAPERRGPIKPIVRLDGWSTPAGFSRAIPFKHLMPVIHPYVVAAEGRAHAADWHINEPQHGYLTPAKLLAMTAIDLLYGDAAPAKEILANFAPAMTKEAYLAFQRGLFKKERYASQEV